MVPGDDFVTMELRIDGGTERLPIQVPLTVTRKPRSRGALLATSVRLNFLTCVGLGSEPLSWCHSSR